MDSLMKLFITISIVLAFLYSCYDYNNPLDPYRDDKRPTNPFNLRVSKISHNKVGLVFEVIGSDILGIIIRRDGVKIDTITNFDSTYTDTNNIQPSTSYSYSVSSFNKHGSSEASNTIKVLTPSENINVFGGLTLNARLEKIEFRKDIRVTITPTDTNLSSVTYPMDTLGHLEIPMIMKPGLYYLTLYRYGFNIIKDTVTISSFKITTLDTFILQDNLPPEVEVFTNDTLFIKHMRINDTVHLDVTSSDSLYSVKNFEWRFEGRNKEISFEMTGTGDTSLVMRDPGLFTAYLTATDENGNSTTDSLYVNVDLFSEVDTAPFYTRQHHAAVVYDNKMWVIGGVSYDTTLSSRFLNDVWYSSNGTDWHLATDSAAFGGREGHEVVVFNNKMYLIGGYPGGYKKAEVWSSTDGATWHLEEDSIACGNRTDHTCTVWNGKIWLIGGKNSDNESTNDIWTSTDGVSWTELIDSTDFPPVSGHTTQVFNNQIWVMGGLQGYYHSDEIWYSSDGLSWSVVPRKDVYNHFNDKQFSGRTNLMSLVYNNQLCVIGGVGELIIGGPGSTVKEKPMDDLWVTDNGHDWRMICGSEWINIIREYHDNDELIGIANSAALVFNGKIWLVGGANYWEYGTSLIYSSESY